MSVVATLDIFCDGEGCLRWTHGATGHAARVADARETSRRAGWITERGKPMKDFCPDCQKKQVSK